MSRPETHRIFDNKIDLGARHEAIQILNWRITDIEHEISRQIRQVKIRTDSDDKDNPQKISEIAEHIHTLTNKLNLLASKLYRLRHEDTKFAFFDVCRHPNHRKVMIAGESHRESMEDRAVIIKEVLVAKRVAKNESIADLDDGPSQSIVCTHPRSARDIAYDLRNDPKVRGWFDQERKSCTCHGTSIGQAGGSGSGIKRKTDFGEISGIAENVKRIRILPKNDD